MNERVKKRGTEKVIPKEEERLEEAKIEKKEKSRSILILSLAIISIAGFAVSLLFLIGVTGATIGSSKGNLWGLIFIIISLLIWAIAEMLWIKGRKKKEVNIKELLEDLEKEGLPMIYKKRM